MIRGGAVVKVGATIADPVQKERIFILFSFYYEHVLKLPQQKGLLSMQPDWASDLLFLKLKRSLSQSANAAASETGRTPVL